MAKSVKFLTVFAFFVNNLYKIAFLLFPYIMVSLQIYYFFMKGTCSVCDASVTLPKNTEESEIVSCTDCKSRLVVQKINNGKVTLEKAPVVEEDWGQ